MKKLLNSILLIDDDYPTNLYNRLVIEEEGIAEKIIDINNAEQAFELLKDNSKKLPDLVLLDINMSIMDGWEFLETIEEYPKRDFSRMHIYILSASKDPEDVEKSKKYKSVSGFLNKPIDINELTWISRTIFDKK